MKGSKTMKENTNNKYAEFDTIVKEVDQRAVEFGSDSSC